MKHTKTIVGGDGKKYQISSDIDCLDNISVSYGYIGGLTVGTMYEIASVTIKEIKNDKLIKSTETPFEHILNKIGRAT